MHHAADQKTHRFFFERDYPDASVLEKLFKALKSAPVTAETLRKKSRVKKAEFEKALEKLWLHGGVGGVSEDQLVRGDESWQSGYAAQRELRTTQLALMARFAQGNQCRMLALVRHFGDQQDSGEHCGRCDVCAPDSSLKQQLISPGLTSLAAAAAQARPPRARKSATRRGRRASRGGGVSLPVAGPSASLVATLRAWRLTEAKKKRVPAFRVLTNRALLAIAEARPRSATELGAVSGVGPKVLQQYGSQLLTLCSRT
jgi:superfamily II DNA helicase RecQ